VDSCGLGEGIVVALVYDNVPSDSIKGGEFLD
jgi:hypothetical protein